MGWKVVLTTQEGPLFWEHKTHKEAQHEAAILAAKYREEGREVLGSSKEDYYLVDDGANVIEIEVASLKAAV